MENFATYNEEIDELPIIIDLPHSGEMIPDDIKRNESRVTFAKCRLVLPDLYDFWYKTV
jgi:hypothetical protein